jgi:hypothetical protein
MHKVENETSRTSASAESHAGENDVYDDLSTAVHVFSKGENAEEEIRL